MGHKWSSRQHSADPMTPAHSQRDITDATAAPRGPQLMSPKAAGGSGEARRRSIRDSISVAQRLKINILAPGDSGSSTFVRNAIFTYGEVDSFEVGHAATHAKLNILQGMQGLVAISKQQQSADPKYAMQDSASASAQHFEEMKIDAHALDVTLSSETVAHAKALWADAGIQNCYHMRNRLGFLLEGSDNLAYLMEHIDRISAPDWKATVEDLVHSYEPTRGLHDHTCEVKGTPLWVVDAGGMLSERQHWPMSYDECKIVVFMASASGYDEVLSQDPSKMRMKDALDTFDVVCRLPEFQGVPIMLVFTKLDRFKEKLPEFPLSGGFFSEYKGDSTPEAAMQYITEVFQKQYAKTGRTNMPLVIKWINTRSKSDVQDVVEEVVKVVTSRPAASHKPNPLNKVFSNTHLLH